MKAVCMERRGITQEGAYVPHLASHDQEAGSRGVEPPFLEAFGWLPMPVAKTFHCWENFLGCNYLGVPPLNSTRTAR